MKMYWIKAQAPRRALAVAQHLDLDVEFVEVDPSTGAMKTPDYAVLNPNMKAPTLVDGETVLWESSAIAAYLCIKAGSDMWPADDPAGQIEVLRWLSWCDNHWSPAVTPFYFEYVAKATFGLGEPDRDVLDGSDVRLLRYARVLDEHLDGRDYVALDRLTIADFQLASMACEWRRAGMPFADAGNVRRWLDGLDTIPAWANPWPTPSR